MTEHPGPLHVAMVVEQLWQPVPGGSGTYVHALAAQLATRSDVHLTGVRAWHRPDERDVDLPPSTGTAASRLSRRPLYAAWSRLRRPRVRPAAGAWGTPYDVIHATTWAVPPRNAPLVVTVHDLAFRRDPTHFTQHGVSFFEHAVGITRHEADVVVVPSRSTRDDCVEAGFDADRVRVVPHGVQTLAVSEEEVAGFRARHALSREVVLWCGTLEPRKNLRVVLEAYRQLLRSGTDLDLVIVGPDGWGKTADDVRRGVDRLPEGRVHVLGRLDVRELHAAYATARVFCFPSLWEGFGMPVLEAMAHGTPVVTSRGTSMAEFGGDGALLVDPQDAVQVADGIVRAAQDDEHGRLAVAARRIAQQYTWQRSADLHVAAYRAAIEHAEVSGTLGSRTHVRRPRRVRGLPT